MTGLVLGSELAEQAGIVLATKVAVVELILLG
jgi:hypothetical protein